MWDVVWTDPSRELVGEHRARKQHDNNKEKKRDDDEGSRARSGRSSMSTASSRSSAESAFARFRSRGLKHINTSKANSKVAASSASSSGLASSSMRSPFSRASDAKSRRSSGLSVTKTFDELRSVFSSPSTDETGRGSHDICLELPREDSISAARRAATTSSPARLAHSNRIAGSPSPGTKKLEASPLARLPIFDLQSPVRKAFIIPNLRPGEPRTPPQSPTKGSSLPSTEQPGSPVHLVPPTASPLRSRKPPGPLPNSVNDLGAGGAPDQPGSAPSAARAAMAEGPGEEPAVASTAWSRNNFWRPADFESLTQEVDVMGSSSPTVVLSRLKEIWATSTTADDHRRLEMEKMRWVFSTLHHLDLAAPYDASRQPTHKIEPAKVHNILALYETKASALYLAGLYPTKRICHLSDVPLPHDAAPNVHPLSVSAVSPSTFPIPPQLFEAVYSMSLPPLCSSSDLHGILHNVSSCLKPGGTLHLVIIDPLPCAHTMGNKLREWLEQHLLVNLRTQSRCTSPSTLLPRWLGEASLRGAGSTLTAAKFYASPDNVRRQQRDPDPAIDRLRTERETKAELRSLVGRMLWREVWGDYVTAGSWWWDDAACMDECLELGTFWEYHMIEAVKDG
ncbi:Uncharacterized protein TPAR_04081 [Tolypocladium paradoxum]|uniref:Uncharacterized protein n=1 Tax=Tolypocladium paradoxum TaxID=94208 RepID=A0A2S4KZV9_9HYPO|nr:Uncharacterized protein TPAR_04081 [Tolypocladium paradoxum]